LEQQRCTPRAPAKSVGFAAARDPEKRGGQVDCGTIAHDPASLDGSRRDEASWYAPCTDAIGRKGAARSPRWKRTMSSPKIQKPITIDPMESARAAHLRYVDDTGPGLRRIRSGKGFRYLDHQRKALRDPEHLERIRHLAIPPAWTDVWICPRADGHIQATGRDARGRKQYRYHVRFREARDETKYERMIAFADALPRIRAAVDEQLKAPSLTREKVLATVVRLLEVTLIRVGNEEYARENGSFGLTTLREDHVDVHGSEIRFHFRGKSGIDHTVKIHDRRLAKVVQRCLGIPGEVLFRYVGEDGEPHVIESSDVNEHLRALAGEDFSAKDFRTWAGTVLAAYALSELEAVDSVTAAKKNIVAAVKRVSRRLGNTPAVCRKCYVHPAVFQAYFDGHLVATLARRAEVVERGRGHRLSAEEEAVLGLIRRQAALPKAA
jgi:DNA topoisomerase I